MPSITATHEFVVPRSMPMTSSALRALDMLQHSTRGDQMLCLRWLLLAGPQQHRSTHHSPRTAAGRACWSHACTKAQTRKLGKHVSYDCDDAGQIGGWWRRSPIVPPAPPHSSRCHSTSCCGAASYTGVLLKMLRMINTMRRQAGNAIALEKSFLDGSYNLMSNF